MYWWQFSKLDRNSNEPNGVDTVVFCIYSGFMGIYWYACTRFILENKEWMRNPSRIMIICGDSVKPSIIPYRSKSVLLSEISSVEMLMG